MEHDSRQCAFAAQACIDSPLGPLTLAATPRGLAGVWFESPKWPVAVSGPVDPRQAHIAQAIEELRAYFAGRSTVFRVALDLQGTAFQRAVWKALLLIPPGGTWTYTQVAEQVKTPQAVRAVGAAIGRNPAGIIVPCHRVIGRDGTLTGYAGGLHRKRALLELEGVLPPQTADLFAPA